MPSHWPLLALGLSSLLASPIQASMRVSMGVSMASLGLSSLLASPIQASMGVSVPKCWLRKGECLDQNEAELDMTGKVKPKLNLNVILAVKDVPNIDGCLSKCEEEEECMYYTLYQGGLDKLCSLVGFNLGTSCQRLSNVCVLHRACDTFDETCGQACTTGRRLAKWDKADDAKTLLVGGVHKPRLHLEEYVDTIEVHDDMGKFECRRRPELHYSGLLGREGAAGALWGWGAQRASQIFQGGQRLVWCGGWRTNDVAASDQASGLLDGEYLASCETLDKEGNWKNNTQETLAMAVARAFFSMVETPYGLYAIGGYNSAAGMLSSIERYDGTAWTLSPVGMTDAKSHTCAVSVPLGGRFVIFVLGGWDAKLDYTANVEAFEVDTDGTLTKNASISSPNLLLPSDKDGDTKFSGKADLACIHFRMGGWKEGILMTGGYRSAGAWLNTAWYLDLSDLGSATSTSATSWATRVTDISRQFVDGRHFHQAMVASMRPLMFGGWSNRALTSSLSFNDCMVNEEDPTRLGVWTEDPERMKTGREKFSAITVPSSFLIGSDIRCPG